MKAKFFLIAFLPILVAAGPVFAEPDMNPGKWEITTESEMVGVPGMQMPTVTNTQCMTEGDPVPQSQGTSQDCAIEDIRQEGDTVAWKIVCSGSSGRMEGTGRVTYKGDTMTGTMDMVMKEAGMQIRSRITGRRIGDCP